MSVFPFKALSLFTVAEVSRMSLFFRNGEGSREPIPPKFFQKLREGAPSSLFAWSPNTPLFYPNVV